MRNILSALVSVTVAAVFAGSLTAQGQQPAGDQGADPAAFAWSDACKDCHKPIFDAWARTKHARALDRLGDGDRRKECVRCHVTGVGRIVEKRLAVVNAGVQCEACHGGAAAHAADPAVRTGLVKKPGDSLCRGCHNEKSPHFKGFVYSAMKGYVHRDR